MTPTRAVCTFYMGLCLWGSAHGALPMGLGPWGSAHGALCPWGMGASPSAQSVFSQKRGPICPLTVSPTTECWQRDVAWQSPLRQLGPILYTDRLEMQAHWSVCFAFKPKQTTQTSDLYLCSLLIIPMLSTRINICVSSRFLEGFVLLDSFIAQKCLPSVNLTDIHF